MMNTYKTKRMVASIVIACSISACATDNGYRTEGTYTVEERSYGSSYGGTTWYREVIPYTPYPRYDQNRNGIPDQREQDRNHNGIPDYRESDRNHNGIPDSRELDRNRNGIQDSREVDRNRNGVPDNRETDRNRNGIPDSQEINRNSDSKPNNNWNNDVDRQKQPGDKYYDGYKSPNKNYNNQQPTYYGR